MTRVVGIGYVIVYFTILWDDCGELSVIPSWIFLEAIGKYSKVMLDYKWCCYAIEVCMMFLCIYDDL